MLALSVLVEIPGHRGAKLVGPLPYSTVLGAHPVDEPAARAFIQAPASAEAKRAYAAAGFEVEK